MIASSPQALVGASAVGVESIVLRGDAATLVPLLQKEGLSPTVLASPANGGKTAAR